MLLWIGFAVLTAGVVGALLTPLWRDRRAVLEPAAADLAVYRHQLEELELEHKRGLVSDADLEGARAEVARRLIKRAEAAGEERPRASDDPVRGRANGDRVFYAIAALIPLLAVSAYLLLGAPQLPGQPLAARRSLPIAQTPVVDLIARVEERLREHPEDGKGWDVIAPIYLRLGRFADAEHSYAQALRLEGESVRRLLGQAEAGLLASNGIVTEKVRKAAERIRVLDPGRIEPRLWLTLGKEQDGDLAGAAAGYKALLEGAPPDAEWRQPVTERLALLESRLRGEPPPPAKGPTSEDVARAGEMSEAERGAMIAGMVDRLASRLKENGSDLGGWLQLVRAYKVLGRDEDALAALGAARRHFKDDEKSLADLDALAKSLGLGS